MSEKSDQKQMELEKKLERYMIKLEDDSKYASASNQNQDTEAQSNSQKTISQTKLSSNQQIESKQQQESDFQQQKTYTQKFFYFMSLAIPDFTVKSFTFINFIFLIVMQVIFELYSLFSFSNVGRLLDLHTFGSKTGFDIKLLFQLQRLITPVFIQFNFLHLMNNLFCLSIFSYTLEKKYGVIRYVILYFVSVIGANLFSTVFHYMSFSMGTNLGTVGTFCLYLLYLIQNQNEVKNIQLKFGLLVYALISTILISLSSPLIDSSGNIGGLIFGFLCALLYQDSQLLKRYKIHKILVLILMILLALFLTFLIYI